VDATQLAAVFYSHYHPDHVGDHFVLRYVLDIARRLGHGRDRPLPVYGPARPAHLAGRLPYKDVFDVRYVEEPVPLGIAGFQVSWVWTDHPLPCLASRWEQGGRSLVYSGDTGPRSAADLVRLARGADLLLIEASLLESRGQAAPGHLTARQAAGIAREAGVRRLLLTHLLPENDPEETLAEAREVFPGAALAEPGLEVEL